MRDVLPRYLCRGSRQRRVWPPRLEVRDDLFAKQANGVEHLLVRCRPDSAQQNCFLDTQGFVEFEKPDAVLRCADAELGTLLTHLLRRGLAWMGPAGETLVARIVALIISRNRSGVIVAPDQPGALTLLLDVPADELGAAPGDDPRILVAVTRRHQRGARRWPAVARGGYQS